MSSAAARRPHIRYASENATVAWRSKTTSNARTSPSWTSSISSSSARALRSAGRDRPRDRSITPDYPGPPSDRPSSSAALRSGARRARRVFAGRRVAGPWRPRIATSSPPRPITGAASAFRSGSRSPTASAIPDGAHALELGSERGRIGDRALGEGHELRRAARLASRTPASPFRPRSRGRRSAGPRAPC